MFFTGDTHFNHAMVIGYCGRPFSTVQENDETIIKRWNSKIKPGNLVYHLGDFGLGRNLSEIIKRLNGKIILIKGNHDWNLTKNDLALFYEVHNILEVKYDHMPITLCHYAMRAWNKSRYGAWHLFSHSHGRLPSLGKSFDIGVDNNNYYPLSIDEVGLKMMMLDGFPED